MTDENLDSFGGGRRFGDAVPHALDLDHTPSLLTTTLPGSQVAINLQSVGAASLGRSALIPAEDTFIVSVCMTPIPLHEVFSKGRLCHRGGYPLHSLHIVNLVDDYSINVFHPHQVVAFYIPRAALDTNIEGLSTKPVTSLSCQPGALDPILQNLALALLPLFERTQETSRLFVDHVALAVCSHLAHRYGRETPQLKATRTSMSRLRIERAKEFMAEHLDGNIALDAVATQVGLSRGHFVRAFRATTGETPHQWLQQHRVDLAKSILVSHKLPLAEVAAMCGFFDQSHLNRVFRRHAGHTPAAWRHLHSRF